MIEIPEIKNVIFSENVIENSIHDAGGACINGDNSIDLEKDEMRLKVTAWSFYRNRAVVGPAIEWTGAALIIRNSTFEENTNTSGALDYGGAVIFDYSLDISNDVDHIIIGEFSLSECTFKNNNG